MTFEKRPEPSIDQVILSINNPEQALKYLEEERRSREEVLWSMLDGKAVNIKKMSNKHLDNTIYLLKRTIDGTSKNN